MPTLPKRTEDVHIARQYLLCYLVAATADIAVAATATYWCGCYYCRPRHRLTEEIGNQPSAIPPRLVMGTYWLRALPKLFSFPADRIYVINMDDNNHGHHITLYQSIKHSSAAHCSKQRTRIPRTKACAMCETLGSKAVQVPPKFHDITRQDPATL